MGIATIGCVHILLCFFANNDGNFNLRVDIPANTSATITFPAWGSGSVLESGKPVSDDMIVNRNHPVQVKVSSGLYNFAGLSNSIVK